MKKLIIIAVSLLSLSACTKKNNSSGSGSSNDTTFNGSYFQIAYNGKNFYCKDAVLKSTGAHLVILTSAANSPYLVLQMNALIGNSVYGISQFAFNLADTGSGYKFEVDGNGSSLLQANPGTAFLIWEGSVTITHNAADYIQGSFTTVLTSTGINYPATGTFKIYH